MPEPASVVVVVASRGRPQELADLLAALSEQSVLPAQVVLSVTQASDYPDNAAAMDSFRVDIVTGSAGLCAQRNRGIDAVDPSLDVIAFFDDDYVPRFDVISGISRLYTDHPEVSAANGVLLADGINGPGLSLEESRRIIASSEFSQSAQYSLTSMEALYGCNMTARRSAMHNVRFDENLPLYGWQEDIDFTSQLGRVGRLVRSDLIVGVHRGVKGGRVSGVKFGYSQIVNPAYLAKKGTMPPAYAMKIAFKNVLANVVRQLNPEPWVDRRGRFKGNLMGIVDLLTRRADTHKVVRL